MSSTRTQADVDWAVLALDLGGTQVRAAVVRSDGTVVSQRRSRTPVEGGGEAIVQACLDALGACRDAHAAAGGSTLLVGIGIAAPGPVDPICGRVIDPPNLGPRSTTRRLPSVPGRASGSRRFLTGTRRWRRSARAHSGLPGDAPTTST